MRSILNAAAAAIALALPSLGLSAAYAQERFTTTVTGPEDAPVVILIPGLASSREVWTATAAALDDTHRVHVLNVRGFAGEPAGANADGPVLQPLIDEIAAYATALNKPALIGHSIGGLISLEAAAARPGEIGRVMVVDALPFYSLLFNPAATVAMSRPYAEMNRTQLLAMTDEQFAATQTQTMTIMTKTEAARPTLIDWSLTSDRRVVAQTMYEVTLDDARPRLSAITAPVTVLYAYDPAMGRPAAMVDQMYSAPYAGLAGVNLKRVDGSFHFIMLAQPETFAEEAAAFLR